MYLVRESLIFVMSLMLILNLNWEKNGGSTIITSKHFATREISSQSFKETKNNGNIEQLKCLKKHLKMRLGFPRENQYAN